MPDRSALVAASGARHLGINRPAVLLMHARNPNDGTQIGRISGKPRITVVAGCTCLAPRIVDDAALCIPAGKGPSPFRHNSNKSLVNLAYGLWF